MELEYTITGEGKNGGNQPKSMERNIAEEEDDWIKRHNMVKKIMAKKRKLSFQK
ncbi:MAG: hypothetical protein RR653_07140 [Clostridia bacterium]